MPWAGHIGFFGVCSRILSNPTFGGKTSRDSKPCIFKIQTSKPYTFKESPIVGSRILSNPTFGGTSSMSIKKT
jgi:hypothetical protein